jgi:hypothetical protein
VPNPHGFKFARFKDGNGTNCIYTNIEWVENLNPGFLNSKAHLEKTKWPKRTKEEMFKYIEETIEQLNMQKEAIKDNRIAEYVTGYATDILRSIYSRYATSRNRKWMRDAYIEYAQDVMLKKFNNGYPIAIFSSFFIVTYREFRSWCRKRKREVEYKDEITYNGWEDIENQQF